MNIEKSITQDNMLSGIIVILVLVLVYLFFFKKEDDTPVKLDNETISPINQPDEPYTVSVGSPKLITRCKPLPEVKQAEQLDFGFKSAYVPNSRGNICDKGKIDDAALFPSLTDEKQINNVTNNGTVIMPVSSFTGDEAPFSANCTFSKPDCKTQSTLFPGELLMKESIPVGSTEAPTDTVESFHNYYEGFAEGASSCGGQKKAKEPYDNYEGFIEGATNSTEPCTVVFYGVDWCGFCQKAKPEWDKLSTDGKTMIDYPNVHLKYIDCEAAVNKDKCADTDGYPTFKINAKHEILPIKKASDLMEPGQERTASEFTKAIIKFIEQI